MTLIERIEAAPEGNRELSDECLLAAGWTESEIMYADLVRPDGKMINRANCPDPSQNMQDAIDWMVPENANCHGYDQTPEGCEGYVSRNYVKSRSEAWLIEGRAATPALALAAAALRARETMKEQSDDG